MLVILGVVVGETEGEGHMVRSCLRSLSAHLYGIKQYPSTSAVPGGWILVRWIPLGLAPKQATASVRRYRDLLGACVGRRAIADANHWYRLDALALRARNGGSDLHGLPVLSTRLTQQVNIQPLGGIVNRRPIRCSRWTFLCRPWRASRFSATQITPL